MYEIILRIQGPNYEERNDWSRVSLSEGSDPINQSVPICKVDCVSYAKFMEAVLPHRQATWLCLGKLQTMAIFTTLLSVPGMSPVPPWESIQQKDIRFFLKQKDSCFPGGRYS